MLDNETKRRIDSARDILVGKIPDPKSQVEQITIALIYKFMDDMDRQAENLPRGKAKFFTNDYKKYAWRNIFSPQNSGQEIVNLYGEALQNMNFNKNVPQLFRDIFKNAYLPYRDPETLKDFLKEINTFEYDHSERLGDAFEYLLSVLGSQGDAGQFRTPRNIIDFMVEIIEPKKNERVLDPACGTAGFLISAYKHIVKRNSKNYDPKNDPKPFELQDVKLSELTINGKGYKGEKLTSDNRKRLIENISGYDISPDMVRLSLVNMYLHGFSNPHIAEYDTLSRDEKWDEKAEVILANPPFMSPKGGIKPHSQFSVQSKRSEVLFVDYMAEHLTPQGRAAIIVPEGIIFQTATAYKQLRKMLVDENFLVGVISLPAGLFNPYSGVKTSIIWLDKALAKKTDKILFVKIENDGFDLGAQRRPIKKNDLPDAYQAIMEYKDCLLEGKDYGFEGFQNIAVVGKSKVAKGGEYSLNGDRYRDVIVAHKSDFPMVMIGDVCDLINGRAFKPSDWTKKEDGGVPIIRIQNLNNPQSSFNYYTGKVLERFLIKEGELLFSWSGSRGTSFGAHIWGGRKAVLNQHIFKINYDKAKVDKKYFYYALNRAVTDVENNLHGGVGLVHITKGNLEKIKIPLPSLSIQQEIVTELDSYQKIIDGARQVVENYKPHIDIDPDWKMVEFNKICTFEYGSSLPSKNRKGDKYPVMGSNGIAGYHDDYTVKGPAIIIGRKGSAGEVVWTDSNCFPIDTTYYVDLKDKTYNFKFLFYVLQSCGLQSLKGGAGIPGLNRNDVYRTYKLPCPAREIQDRIVARLEQERQIIEANKQLVEMYEQKIKDRIAKVWGEK